MARVAVFARDLAGKHIERPLRLVQRHRVSVHLLKRDLPGLDQAHGPVVAVVIYSKRAQHGQLFDDDAVAKEVSDRLLPLRDSWTLLSYRARRSCDLRLGSLNPGSKGASASLSIQRR